MAIADRIARPSAPPTCCEVLIRPDARPASSGFVPITAAIVTDTNASPRPKPTTSDGNSTSPTYEPPALTWLNHTSPAVSISIPVTSTGLKPMRVVSCEATPAETMIMIASGRYETPVLSASKPRTCCM